MKKRIVGLVNRLSGIDYPTSVGVSSANNVTLNFIKTTTCKVIAEIGIYQGNTTEGFASFLNGSGELHLFDFQDRVEKVKRQLAAQGHANVVVHGNSHKTLDSYNWSLMKVLQATTSPVYDYVFLDGAHTWNVDALTFFLTDKLLKDGGYIDFDDYAWSLEKSPALNPVSFPLTSKLYTEEQIKEQHVKHIVDLLVKRSERYKEIVPDKIYQKISSDK